MMKKVVAVALAALVGFSFISCGSKEYNGFKVTKGPAKVEVINLPAYSEGDNGYNYTYAEETKEFPLMFYMVQEREIRTFVGKIAGLDGLSEEEYEEKYEPGIREISSWDWGVSKISKLTSEDKEKIKKYYDTYIDVLNSEDEAKIARFQFADDFATEVWLVVDELADIADSIYKANNGEGWWDSAEEVVNSYKDEIAGCKDFLVKYFPGLRYSVAKIFAE